jgi:hypothetical protein
VTAGSPEIASLNFSKSATTLTFIDCGGMMRKLKLQMQITVDGFVAGSEGQLDWMMRMTPTSDEKPRAFINHLIDTSDTILLGRKMTSSCMAAQPSSPR